MLSSSDSSEGETRDNGKVRRQRVPSEIAVMVGGVTKVVFMLVGWVRSIDPIVAILSLWFLERSPLFSL